MTIMDYQSLRLLHPRLIYDGYSIDQKENDLTLTFNLFLEPNLHFQPKLRIKNLNPKIIKQLGKKEDLAPQLDRLFFHLGLAEIPSYFKAACPKEILIKHQGQIEEKALGFWQDLLINGLGEFYYHNQIDFTAPDFVQIKLAATKANKSPTNAGQIFARQQISSKILIPVGGGKDSATVLGMVEEHQLPYDIFLLQPHAKAAKEIALLLQKDGLCQNIFEVERIIDPQLIKLNQKGYLNGHTPFSAYLAFISSTIAYLNGQENILLGNEASSEEENLTYLGHKINHQYSKSLNFEQKFSKHSQEHLFLQTEPRPIYRSLLRELSELEITKKLCDLANKETKFARIMTIFKSCNVGQKDNRWCHNCPKCAFVFSMLSAYLDEEFVSSKIFSENLFAKESLRQTFFDLAGFGDKKPFECVGTFSEVRAALLLAEKRSKKPSLMLRTLSKKIHQKELMDKLRKKSILILGMGREGLSTLDFLRKNFANKKIAIADRQAIKLENQQNLITYFGEQYLEAIDQYEIIIKTAGIPLTTKEIQNALAKGSEVLSNTQIFFTLCEGKIIGITGTKGKSTTSKLIFEILRDGQKKTILLGNIGDAPLNQLAKIDQNTLIVDELSCHQLAELQNSPHVAVVLDIKSEHLDYYKDFASYFAAKSAIARYQKSDDYLIYNPNLAGAKQMAELSQAQKLIHGLEKNSDTLVYKQGQQIFYQNEAIIDLVEIPLIGEHNLYNVMPAILVAKLFGVDKQIIRKTIKNFRNLAHRLELVAEINQVQYYDDSIAVNPHATIMAIKAFPKKSIILLAGGYERNQDFSELAKVIADYQVKYLIALPSTGSRLVEFVLRETSIKTAVVETIAAAVQLAKQQAKPGDIVLLSPASASYNSFANYEERGNAFAQAALERK